jgi:putative NADH-flavin reductase
MRIAVFGATGGTGQQVVKQALALGHEVTALARRPQALGIADERLRVFAGDILDPAAAVGPVATADAVVSALGIGYSRAATTVYSEGTSNIIKAMQAADVRRIVCLSTAGMDSSPGASLPVKVLHSLVLRRLLREPYADMLEMERRLAETGLDWTVVRSVRLTNGPRRGTYRVGVQRCAGRGLSISRADLAAYLLKCVDDTGVSGVWTEISY